MTYAEKLRDPRWQKLRLKILERDKWKCCACGDDTKNLQVHHLYYAKLDPWEYPTECYQTLCEDCHDQRQATVDSWVSKIRVALGDVRNCDLEGALEKMLDIAEKHSKSYVEPKPVSTGKAKSLFAAMREAAAREGAQ